jgi:hypothetical protein
MSLFRRFGQIRKRLFRTGGHRKPREPAAFELSSTSPFSALQVGESFGRFFFRLSASNALPKSTARATIPDRRSGLLSANSVSNRWWCDACRRNTRHGPGAGVFELQASSRRFCEIVIGLIALS